MRSGLSVIVPVYNVDSFLPRCIESILTQTFTDFEVILVDDGSTDGSSAILDQYVAKYYNSVLTIRHMLYFHCSLIK